MNRQEYVPGGFSNIIEFCYNRVRRCQASLAHAYAGSFCTMCTNSSKVTLPSWFASTAFTIATTSCSSRPCPNLQMWGSELVINVWMRAFDLCSSRSIWVCLWVGVSDCEIATRKVGRSQAIANFVETHLVDTKTSSSVVISASAP